MIDIKALRKAKNLTQKQLDDIINVGQARISRYESGKEVTEYITEKLMKSFDDYASYMIIDNQVNEDQIYYQVKNNGNIMHIPQAAEAGFGSGAFDGILQEEIETWSIPGLKGECYSFVVNGDSMMDTLRSGEIIITSKSPVESYDSIQNDFLYVLHLKDGIKVKRLGKHYNKSMLWLFSDNVDYPDEEINISEIINLYQGRRILSFNLSHKMRYE